MGIRTSSRLVSSFQSQDDKARDMAAACYLSMNEWCLPSFSMLSGMALGWVGTFGVERWHQVCVCVIQ
jgi:hypothetical protein